MKTTLPTIHLNGTGARSLAEEYHALRMALLTAEETLQRATCHPRDFYPQGDSAYPKARSEREEAFALLNRLTAYAEAWELHATDSPLYH